MNSKLTLEMIWWLVTALVVLIFILPVHSYIGSKYQFYVPNIVLMVLFITFTRYIFLLKHTFLARLKWLKLVLIFLPIPFFFYALNSLFDFQDFLDKEGHIRMLDHMNPDKAMEISKYIRYQFIFFATGAILVLFLMPIRMIISIWRGINKGTV